MLFSKQMIGYTGTTRMLFENMLSKMGCNNITKAQNRLGHVAFYQIPTYL